MAGGRYGVIVKRGKGYGVSVYDPALKRKRWVGTFRTKGEAREAEREAARRRRVGGVTCDEFATLWLRTIRGGRRHATHLSLRAEGVRRRLPGRASLPTLTD